ncbi:MAG: hypothetical protein JWO38_5254 [Gemmataceae bacterium]|nr:hypothetical protein [Gemmataceae bacterium]
MSRLFSRTAALSFAAALTAGPMPAAQDTPPAPPDGASVQARGPVHEAFARPADGPARGPIVTTEPPAPIKEVPPDQRPDVEGVQWIPGYWAWDDEGKDYLWVSGCWRVPPPGRQWVAGNWGRVDGGWRWMTGFWSAAGVNAPQPVADTPPASLEAGPSTPPPDDDGYYIPGQWLFRNGEWVWQPGSWVQNQADMVYVPPTYLPAQTGSLYVPGYWDYPLQNRGLLFAPVGFGGTPWLGNPGWAYRPGYTVGLGGLLGSLFARPGYGSYYFGNYFGRPYQGLGYLPWTAYGRRGYDPLLNYYRWANRGNPGWYGGLAGLYTGRLNGSLPVPAVAFSHHAPAVPALAPTLIAQHTVPFGRGMSVTPVNSLRTVHPLTQTNHVRLTGVNPGELAGRPAFQTRQSFASPGGGGPVAGAVLPGPGRVGPSVGVGSSFPAAVSPGGGMRLVSPAPLASGYGGSLPGSAWRPSTPGTVAPAIHYAPAGHSGYPYHATPGYHGGYVHPVGPVYHPGPVHHAAPVHYSSPVHHAGPSFHGGGGHGGGMHGGGGHGGGGHGGGRHR